MCPPLTRDRNQIRQQRVGGLRQARSPLHHRELAKKISLQSLIYIQRELRNSGDFPNFFVPLNAFTPRQYRIQEQIVFTF